MHRMALHAAFRPHTEKMRSALAALCAVEKTGCTVYGDAPGYAITLP